MNLSTIAGTYLQGYVRATYAELRAAFGRPTNGDGYKIDACWVIQEGDVVATVYNYKNGRNYLGKRRGTPKTRITEWNIGGRSRAAVDLIERRLAAQK